MSALIISIRHCVGGLTREVKKEKEIKGIQIGKEEVNSFYLQMT